MANLFHLALAAALCASLAIAAPRDLTVSWNIDAAKPVNVTLYYESLCPGCHQFILESLIPTWEKVKNIGLMSVVLRPYGNARETKEGDLWKFECQHGVHECEGNVLETCILNYYPNATQHIPIIKCVEGDFFSTSGADWEKTLNTCASTGVDVSKVSKCVKGREGNILQHQMALATGPHEWVPWVILDGKPNKDALDNLLKEVCKAYKGTPPSICKDA